MVVLSRRGVVNNTGTVEAMPSLNVALFFSRIDL
jgi:hypothetical protein